MQASRARRRQLHEVGDRLRSALLREPEQRDEDLRRRDGIGQRTVTRHSRRAEEVRELREPEPPRPTGQEALREPDRVDHGRRHASPREALDRAIEKAHVEPRVVRHEHRLARKREEPPHGEIGARSAAGRPGRCR